MKTEIKIADVDTKGKTSGEHSFICPSCSHTRKPENRKTPCLRINLTTGIGHCHNCGGFVMRDKAERIETEPEYIPPTKQNITKLTDSGVEYFKQRGISQRVLNENKITSTKDGRGIVFPYLENGELVNYKIRSMADKRFMQSKGGKPTMFNFDRIKESKTIIVCEGEIDSMSFNECGVEYSTSVNQGAPNVTDTNVEKKLKCIIIK